MANYNGIYNRIIKRIIGFVLSALLIIVFSPVLICVSIAIFIDSGSPIFYRAPRGGYKGGQFMIYKFRTMVKEADKIGGGTTAFNDDRITRVGLFLRKTKLDEFANLFSIFKGDMSFIGPRPELLKYTQNYTQNEKCILEVRPGMTDYSSIEFINLDEIVGEENADIIYEKKVLPKKNELRVKYANSVSLKVDFYLFWKTIVRVITKALTFLVNKEKNGVFND